MIPRFARSRALRHVAAVLILAIGYYVTGWLALFLAIPPWFAAPLWPPSGVALAAILLLGYRVWPGVVLGSICVAASNFLDSSSSAALARSGFFLASIGLGATLQAVMGAFLVRRYVGHPLVLEQANSIGKFLYLGAAVSCLISPTLGMLTLFIGGIVPGSELLLGWWRWWVGDSIGVLIFAPLALVLAGRPRHVWQRRRLTVALPLSCALAAAVTVFVLARGWEAERIAGEFEHRAHTLTETLRERLDVYLAEIYAIASLYGMTRQLERDKFHAFVTPLIARNPGIQALEWIPRVPHAERAAYKEAARRDGFSHFQITERGTRSQMIPAAQRDEYFPVYYVEPYASNTAAMGFDLASSSIRRQPLEEARDTGLVVASGRVTLLDERGHQFGFLVFMPIYDSERPLRTVEERRSALRGFVLGVFRVGLLVETDLRHLLPSGIVLRIFDETEEKDNVPLYDSSIADEPASAASVDEDNSTVDEQQHSTHLELLTRRWTLRFAPTRHYLAAQPVWQHWLVLTAGLLFVGLLGAVLLIVTGHSVGMERLVKERDTEITARKNSEALMKETVAELTRSNAELELFAYVASHDMQEPLRMVTSFMGLLEDEYKEQLNDEARDYIDFAVDGARRMQRLINDLLTYSRVGTRGKAFEPTNANAVLDRAIANLRLAIAENAAEVTRDDLPTIMADKEQLVLLLQNLIANAIKFRGQVPPKVHVSAERGDDEWVFSVKDNGIGIAAEYVERVFVLFQRLHTRDNYPGTGIGLAICKKTVERHGGRIWLESQPEIGSTFYFAIPQRGNAPA
ncbi:MAG: CHASE domain-containing protein [Proteobacteria bacterium]|nr:CHASE domain-containing protein [Pseudomonadota bacterium]